MKFIGLLLGVALLGVTAQSALPVGPPLGFRTQINRLNSFESPYTGALVLRVKSNGTLSGGYESDSIRPDPLYGRLTPVTGTISGNHILLQIGTGIGAFSITGTVNRQTITGSATQRGRVWTFTAVRVHLRNPPATT
jgi:hypothetical protein